MIELEIKLSVNEFPKLTSDYSPAGTSRIVDTYFDNSTYDYVNRGIFIRKRGNRIDIKYLISKNEHSVCNEYNTPLDKFTSSNQNLIEVLKILGFTFSGYSFDEFLKENALSVLLEIDKSRTKYKKGNVTVCFDVVEKLGKYIEVESVFDELNDSKSAKSQLLSLIDSDIVFSSGYREEKTGYVELYLKENNPLAYSRCMFKG